VTLTTGQAWVLIAGLVVMTAVIKAAGPVLVGGRELPTPFLRVVSFAAAPLLTALVLTSVLADGRRLAVGADTAGVLVGGLLLALRVPLLLAAGAAVAVTAALRAFA
jgi:branched-subunit amino acid transport protein